jgi:hypothetical protein
MATRVSIYRGTPKAVNRKLLLIILIIELIVLGIIMLARWNESRASTSLPPTPSSGGAEPRAQPRNACEDMADCKCISVRPVAWCNWGVSRWNG